MSHPESEDPADGEDESPLAKLSEQITRRLQAGQPVAADDDQEQDPSCSEPIRGLLPTLRELAELGRSISRDRRIRKFVKPAEHRSTSKTPRFRTPRDQGETESERD
jgi:hypothetical protein